MADYCDRIINYFIHSSASRNTLLIIWKCLLRIRYSFWRICCFNYCCRNYENCRFILGGFYQVTIFVENILILVNINTINFNINFNIVYHRDISLPPSLPEGIVLLRFIEQRVTNRSNFPFFSFPSTVFSYLPSVEIKSARLWDEDSGSKELRSHSRREGASVKG